MTWCYKNKVRYFETDRMGVVHHSNYLRFLENARMDWMDENVMKYSELEKLGVIVPAVSAAGNFKGFLHFDEHYTIYVKLVEYTGVRIKFFYEICSDETGKLCYDGYTSHYFSSDALRTGKDYMPISIKHKFPEIHEKMLSLLEEEN